MVRALVVVGMCLVVVACGASDAGDRPLTVDEGAALLGDIREKPQRAESLTPAERKYVQQILNKPGRSVR